MDCAQGPCVATGPASEQSYRRDRNGSQEGGRLRVPMIHIFQGRRPLVSCQLPHRLGEKPRLGRGRGRRERARTWLERAGIELRRIRPLFSPSALPTIHPCAGARALHPGAQTISLRKAGQVSGIYLTHRESLWVALAATQLLRTDKKLTSAPAHHRQVSRKTLIQLS